ncbi:hypothetical protein FRC16_010668 [Serendipita sp. 398]|nr:hypothetical protein FRC16_010668 [Serendipita sp. 398]
MSEEQKEWRLELAQHKDTIHSKIGSILNGLAKSFSELKVQANDAGSLSTSLTKKVEVAIQTEEDMSDKINSNGIVSSTNSLSNGVASMDIVQSPPQHPPSPPHIIPLDVETLRAQAARSVALTTNQESLIRSLETSIIELRRDNDVLLQELEARAIEIRKHEASLSTQKNHNNRLISDLQRAGGEVERLRASIESFHKPSSLVYQSIKDAVLREMRGEQPLNTMFQAIAGANDVGGRPTKRPRTEGSASNSTSQTHSPQSAVQQPASPAQTQRLQTSTDTSHPPQNVGPGMSPSLKPAARDVRSDVVHGYSQGNIAPAPGTAPSLKRPRENTLPSYSTPILARPAGPHPPNFEAIADGTRRPKDRPGHRQHRSWSVDGTFNSNSSLQAQAGDQSQPQQAPPPTVLYRLDPPAPGQTYPTAVPVYQLPAGQVISLEQAQPDVRPRSTSASMNHIPNKPVQYEFSQAPSSHNQSRSVYPAPGIYGEPPSLSRETMRPPSHVPSTSAPNTTVTQPTIGQPAHPHSIPQPSRDPRGGPPTGMPQPPNVSQPPLAQQVPIGSANSRTVVPTERHGQPVTRPLEQTMIVPYLLGDPLAQKLAGKLFGTRRDGHYTVMQCNICGVNGQLSSDFKAFLTHSMTAHRDKFDAAYRATFREVVAVPTEQAAFHPAAAGNTTTSR